MLLIDQFFTRNILLNTFQSISSPVLCVQFRPYIFFSLPKVIALLWSKDESTALLLETKGGETEAQAAALC